MRLNLLAQMPRRKVVETSQGKENVYIIGLLIPFILIICFVKSLEMVIGAWLFIGFVVGTIIIAYIKDWIEPVFFIERSFQVYEYTLSAEFIFTKSQYFLILQNQHNVEIYNVKSGNIIVNRKFDEYTLSAQFTSTKSQSLLILQDQDHIEIHDVKSGNIIVNLKVFTLQEVTLKSEEYGILFVPSNKFILIVKGIERKDATCDYIERNLIQMWNINTSSLVFELISQNRDLGNFIFHKNEKSVFYTPTYRNRSYGDDYDTYSRSLIVWKTKNGEIMFNETLSIYDSLNEKELENEINNCLKSHKELGELIDYQSQSLNKAYRADEADKEENAIKLSQIKIIYPSGSRCYDKNRIDYDYNIVSYNVTKLKDYTFVEKATSIIIKVPRKEIK